MIKEALLTMTLINPYKDNLKNWKDDILRKWDESKNLPRKKKKAIRKHLQFDWSLACYKPFDHFTF